MNKYLSLVLMTRLLNLPYIQKYGGIVQTIQKVIPVAGSDKPVIKRIPISAVHEAPANCQDLTTATSIQFIPESKLKGMLYFEDGGSVMDTTKRHTGLVFWRSRMRLIVWMNQKLISETYNIELAAMAMNEMITLLCTNPVNMDVFKSLQVKVASVPSATSALFSEYDYDEKETQFLMPPYDFFGIDLDVYFGIPKGCRVPVVPNPDAPFC